MAEFLNYLLVFCYLVILLSFFACLQDEGSSFTPDISVQDPMPIPKQTAHVANRMVIVKQKEVIGHISKYQECFKDLGV